jgi:hypothetical protein
MSLVGVKYVGKKPSKQDNVAGTGLIWSPGEIHVVPASLVPKFQAHPDVWAIVPVGEEDLQAVGLVVETLGTTQQEVDENRAKETEAITESVLTTPDLPATFEPMSKSEIAAFAERNYGLKLEHTRMTKDALVQAVRNTHNARVMVN